MRGFSFHYRLFHICLACFQNMTMGGILYGWASISGGLLASPPEKGGAGLSADYLQMMFVTAAFFSFLGPISLGLILDNFGPRFCSLSSIALIAMGCLLFSFSDPIERPYFLPALCLIAFGGPGAQSAIIHLANLFPNWKATTTAFLTGSFQLSFIVFLIFDQLWLWKGITYSQLFLGYTVVCLINGLISFFFWPDTPFSFEEQAAEIVDHEKEGEEEDEETQISIGHIRLPSVFIHHSREKPVSPSQEMKPLIMMNNDNQPSSSSLTTMDNLKEVSLLEQIKSPPFVRLVGFFLVNAFWVNFYIGSFNVQLGDENLLTGEEKLNYARLFTLIITLGVIAIPLIGTIMDKFNFPMASAATSLFGLLWATFLVAETKLSLILSFICYSLFRTFLFTFVFAYLADTLGFKYFGVLAGIMFVLGGVLSFLQVPLVELVSGTCHASSSDCSEGSWKVLYIVMALMIGGTFYFSYKDWQSREENKVLGEISSLRKQRLEEERQQQQASLLYSQEERQSFVPSFKTASPSKLPHQLKGSANTSTFLHNQMSRLQPLSVDHSSSNRSYGSMNQTSSHRK